VQTGRERDSTKTEGGFIKEPRVARTPLHFRNSTVEIYYTSKYVTCTLVFSFLVVECITLLANNCMIDGVVTDCQQCLKIIIELILHNGELHK